MNLVEVLFALLLIGLLGTTAIHAERVIHSGYERVRLARAAVEGDALLAPLLAELLAKETAGSAAPALTVETSSGKRRATGTCGRLPSTTQVFQGAAECRFWHCAVDWEHSNRRSSVSVWTR